MKKIPVSFIIILLLLISLTGAVSAQTAPPVRVGIYFYPPLQQIYAEGTPQGFAVDILNHIAEKEGWNLTYQQCTYEECLSSLENGDLDLVSAVREQDIDPARFATSQEALIQISGQVFTSEGSRIKQVSDLQGKPIALVRGGDHTKAFWEMLQTHNIQGNQILVNDYSEVLQAIASGRAAAGVVDQLFAQENAAKYQVRSTGIMFNPLEIVFIASRDAQNALLPTIDQHLISLKSDPDSFYYQSFDRMINPPPTSVIPTWLKWSLIASGGTVLILLAAAGSMRYIIRKKTRSLQESADKYQRFFKTSKDSVFITSKDGEWIDVNDATLQLFDYQDREEFLNTPVIEFYADPDDRWNHIQKIEEKDFLKEYPVALRKKDGSVINTLFTSAAVRDESGSVIALQGTIRDITEELKDQSALETYRERLDLAIKGTNVGLWDWDIPNDEIVIDDRWADIIGHTKEEISPLSIESWEELIHPDDLEKFYELISRHFARDLEQYSLEMRMKHKQGHWVWGLAQGRVVEWAEDGKPLRMAGTHQDISDRIQAELEIKEHIRKLKSMHKVSTALTSTLSLNEVLDLIMENIIETIPYSSATIFLVEGEHLRIVTSRGIDEDIIGKTYPLDSPLFQEIKETKQTIIIDDASKDPRFQGWENTGDVRGWMGVPLLIKGDLIGHITFDSYQAHAYGYSDAELAKPFAAQAAQAIENARLYEQIQQYAEELEQRVQERTSELQKIVNLMAGREVRMAELKKIIKVLRNQLQEAGLDPAVDDPLGDDPINFSEIEDN